MIPAKTRVRFSPFRTLKDAVAEAWPIPEPSTAPAETPQGDVGTMRAKGVKAKAAGTKPKVKVKAVSAVSKPTPKAKKAQKKPKVKPIGYKVGKR